MGIGVFFFILSFVSEDDVDFVVVIVRCIILWILIFDEFLLFVGLLVLFLLLLILFKELELLLVFELLVILFGKLIREIELVYFKIKSWLFLCSDFYCIYNLYVMLCMGSILLKFVFLSFLFNWIKVLSVF